MGIPESFEEWLGEGEIVFFKCSMVSRIRVFFSKQVFQMSLHIHILNLAVSGNWPVPIIPQSFFFYFLFSIFDFPRQDFSM